MANTTNISNLKYDPRNARRHTPRNVGMVEHSIQRDGFGRSILVANDGTIIAGNATVEAAAAAGIENVIVVESDGKSIIAVKRTDVAPGSPEFTKLALSDNRAAELADWDSGVLAALADDGADLSQFWFEDELAELLAGDDEPVGGNTDPDDVPDVPDEPTTKPGDLWLLGRHRLLCGDSTVVTDVDRLMDGQKARLLVTSPPYNQKLDSFKPSGMQKENPAFVERMASSYADSMDEGEYQAEQVQLLELLRTYMTPDASMFYNHKNRYRDKRVVSPWEWLSRLSFPVRQEIVWDRGSSITMNARMFIPAEERIFWLRVGDQFLFNDTIEIKSWGTVWNVAAVNDVKVSAAFATDIPRRCIRAASEPGDIVLEPYSGSGTTIIAAEENDRTCYAMETNPAYVDVAVRRWEQFTGQTATLAYEQSRVNT